MGTHRKTCNGIEMIIHGRVDIIDQDMRNINFLVDAIDPTEA